MVNHGPLKKHTVMQWGIQPGKKGSVSEGQLLISLFSIIPHFLLKLEVDQ